MSYSDYSPAVDMDSFLFFVRQGAIYADGWIASHDPYHVGVWINSRVARGERKLYAGWSETFRPAVMNYYVIPI